MKVLRKEKKKVKQFCVIGIGRFGLSLARTLFEMGHEVMVIDTDEKAIRSAAEYVTHAVQADSTSEEVARSLGLQDFDVVVLAIGQNIQASILTAILLKEIGCKYVLAKVRTDLHGKVLEKIGVDRLVFPERDMGVRMAHSIVSRNLVDFIELSPDYSLVEVVAPLEMSGSTLKELGIRESYGVNIVAIRSRGGETNISPGAEDTIREGDMMVVVGENKVLKQLGWV